MTFSENFMTSLFVQEFFYSYSYGLHNRLEATMYMNIVWRPSRWHTATTTCISIQLRARTFGRDFPYSFGITISKDLKGSYNQLLLHFITNLFVQEFFYLYANIVKFIRIYVWRPSRWYTATTTCFPIQLHVIGVYSQNIGKRFPISVWDNGI